MKKKYQRRPERDEKRLMNDCLKRHNAYYPGWTQAAKQRRAGVIVRKVPLHLWDDTLE
jgi:hypothetical protein